MEQVVEGAFVTIEKIADRIDDTGDIRAWLLVLRTAFMLMTEKITQYEGIFDDMREDGLTSPLEMAELKRLLTRFVGQADEDRCETKGGFCYTHDFDDEEGRPCPVRRGREILGEQK